MKKYILIISMLAACGVKAQNRTEVPYKDTVTIKAGVIISDELKLVDLYRIECYDYIPYPAEMFYRKEPFGLHHVFITDIKFKDYHEPIMFYKELRRSSNNDKK